MPNSKNISRYHLESSETLRDAANVNATGEGRNAVVNESRDENAALKPSGGAVFDGVFQKRKQSKSSKNLIKLGTWNIRTLKKLGKLELLINELDKFQIDVAGLAEVRWRGSGHFTTDEHTIIYSGNDRGTHGVGFILNKKMSKSLLSYNAINERIILLKLRTKPVCTNIIQIYAPTAEYSDEVLEEFYNELQTAKDSLPAREVCIIMGDFNAKIGEGEDHVSGIGPYGLGERNDRGDSLATFCQANNLVLTNTMFFHHPRKRYTWISPGDRYRNQIDFIAIDRSWFSSILDARTQPGADGDSDHQLVIAKLRLKSFPQKKPATTNIKFDTDKLSDSAISADYMIQTENYFSVLMNELHYPESTPNEMWEEMKVGWKAAASKVLGKRQTKKPKPWISNEVKLMADEKRKAKQRIDHVKYKTLKREIQRKIRQDRRSWLEKECAIVANAHNLGKSKEMFQQIRKLKRKPSANQISVNDKEGNVITDPLKIMARWYEYGKELYSGSSTNSPVSPPDEIEPEPLLSEVENALKKLANGKSQGLDGIPAELIKHSGTSAIKALHLLCKKIWSTCSWPDDWKEQEFVMLHKSGNTKECSNYRTIALISHASKILLIIILNRMKQKAEMEISQMQAGFRPNRGTADMLFIIQILLEKLIETKSEAIFTFIDYSKAFDNVSHDLLFVTMRQMGFPIHIVSLLQSLYYEQKGKIRWNREHSNAFPILKGVRQGCILSPQLFSLYTEQILRNANLADNGVNIGGHLFSNLRYADDTALVETNITRGSEMLRRINEEGKKAGLLLNAKKTKILQVGSNTDGTISIEGENLEKVENFKYLGSIKSANGRCEKDIRSRIGMAKQRMTALNNIWKDRSITRNLKLKLIEVLVWPVLMYGCEGWTLTKADERRIEAAEMWFLRRLLRISWTSHRTNDSILQELNIQRTLLSNIKRRKLKYFGHAIRHKTCSTMKEVVQGVTEGRRGRGRPATSYVGNITTWTGMRIGHIYRACENRDRWRGIVKEAASAANISNDDAVR